MSPFLVARPILGLIAIALPTAALAGVVAQWNMDNDFGTVMEDSSGNGNNGTLKNVATSASGYIFNGTSSMVNVRHSASLLPGDKPLTYTARFQTDRAPAVGTDYDLIRKGCCASSGGGFKLEILNRSGKAVGYCSVEDVAGHKLSATSVDDLADGKLHTATCSKTATSLTLTIDDMSPIVKTGTLGAITNTKGLILGCKAYSCSGVAGDFFYGVMRSATISIGD